jgi:hypothetical protein
MGVRDNPTIATDDEARPESPFGPFARLLLLLLPKKLAQWIAIREGI